MSKILMLVGDFSEDYETMVPFQAMQLIGHEVHAVCPGKRAGDRIRTAVHDFEGDQTYTEKRGHDFTLNATFDEIRPEQYDGLMIPGGRAPEYLRLDTRVKDTVRAFAQANKPIASICHGIQILAACDLLRGRTVTCYPACEPDVLSAGGTYQAVAMDACVVEGNLVTAPGWPAHTKWLAQFERVLEDYTHTPLRLAA